MPAKSKLARIVATLACALALACALTGCGHHGESPEVKATSVDELTTECLGVQEGTLYEDALEEKAPNLSYHHYVTPADMIIALETGKIDGYLTEDISLSIEQTYFPWLTSLEGSTESSEVAIGVSPYTHHDQLLEQLNEFIAACAKNGVAEEMDNYWLKNFNPDLSRVDKSGITGENGKLAIAAEVGYQPFSYVGGGEVRGYDIDFMYRFCRAYGYEPEIHLVEYGAISAGLNAGKYDLGANIIIAEERDGFISLTDPYKAVDIVVAVADEDILSDYTTSNTVAESFEKTFIKDDRWKMFLEGMGTTLLIVVCSLIFGSLLGLLLYLFCKSSGKTINRINKALSWFVTCTPTVLLLMILYYLVFTDWADIGGTWVAVVCFTLLFGYGVFEILEHSVEAVGRGQMEAARALGYSDGQAFFHIVLPQVLKVSFPQIKNEIIMIIKETAIVGFISVSDLTRVSDIIRSRTYDAFFPLITTAIIYYLITWLIILIVRRLEFHSSSRERSVERIKQDIKINEID